LGLAFVRVVAEKHDGAVRADHGGGTAFHLILPLTQTERETT
jgi:signal transduction histidine kinase